VYFVLSLLPICVTTTCEILICINATHLYKWLVQIQTQTPLANLNKTEQQTTLQVISVVVVLTAYCSCDFNSASSITREGETPRTLSNEIRNKQASFHLFNFILFEKT